MKALCFLWFVVALICTLPAHAKVYKCVDETGKTSFQQQPCAEGQKEKTVKGIKAGGVGGGDPIEITEQAFVGTWCFYEQSFEGGDTVTEQATLKLTADGKYSWSDKFWNQTGTWSLEDDVLSLTNVGRHKITKVTANHIDMTRFSNMKWRRGGC